MRTIVVLLRERKNKANAGRCAGAVGSCNEKFTADGEGRVFVREIAEIILTEIEGDPTIKTRDIILDVESAGLFKKRKYIHIRGTVRSREQEERVSKIAMKHACGLYEIVNHMTVRQSI